MRVQIFDPSMCCSTGVCGPVVDPGLARFASDVKWLKEEGVEVERYNLSQQPAWVPEDLSISEHLLALVRPFSRDAAAGR